MLLNLIEQGLVTDIEARGRQLPVPIATLKGLLNFFTLGIVLEAAHQCFEVTVRVIAVITFLKSANAKSASLQLQFFNSDALIFQDEEALHEIS